VEGGCRDFYMNYAIGMTLPSLPASLLIDLLMIAIGLTIAASLFTVAINVFLKSVMKVLAKKEYHNTLDEENVSYCPP
jgi:hypothetical protein